MGESQIEVRQASPEDANGIVEALRRTEGLTYFNGWMYDPESVAQAIESGRIISWIAVAPDDPRGRGGTSTVVAHGALEFADVPRSQRDSSARRTLVEYGMVFTDPRLRGGGLAQRVGAAAMEWAMRHGVDEIWMWATTRRPFAQRAIRKSGAQEMCLLLAMVPPGVNRGHADDFANAPAAAMLFVLRLGAPVESGRWFIPKQHLAALTALMSDSPVQLHTIGDAPPPAQHRQDYTGGTQSRSSSPSRTPSRGFDVEYVESLRFAVIELHRSQSNSVANIMRAVFAAAASGAQVTYLDIDPDRSDLMAMVTSFEEHGFTFAGIHPDYPTGRLRFRLQVLTCRLQPRQEISVVSERGITLLNHVWEGLPSAT